MTVYAVLLVILFGPYNQAPHTRVIADNLASREACEAVAAAVNAQHPGLSRAVCVEKVRGT